jgi:hypothetical protein
VSCLKIDCLKICLSSRDVSSLYTIFNGQNCFCLEICQSVTRHDILKLIVLRRDVSKCNVMRTVQSRDKECQEDRKCLENLYQYHLDSGSSRAVSRRGACNKEANSPAHLTVTSVFGVTSRLKKLNMLQRRLLLWHLNFFSRICRSVFGIMFWHPFFSSLDNN